MADDKNLVTPEGKQKLEAELQELQEVVKPQILKDIERGTVIFNKSGDESGLAIARDRQSFNEYRINEIVQKLQNAVVFDSAQALKGRVNFGTEVTLENEKREVMILKIVGVEEANIREGKISHLTNLANQLMGKKVGDEMMLSTPQGNLKYKLVEMN